MQGKCSLAGFFFFLLFPAETEHRSRVRRRRSNAVEEQDACPRSKQLHEAQPFSSSIFFHLGSDSRKGDWNRNGGTFSVVLAVSISGGSRIYGIAFCILFGLPMGVDGKTKGGDAMREWATARWVRIRIPAPAWGFAQVAVGQHPPPETRWIRIRASFAPLRKYQLRDSLRLFRFLYNCSTH